MARSGNEYMPATRVWVSLPGGGGDDDVCFRHSMYPGSYDLVVSGVKG
jgi:hypothetical protein